MRILLNLIAILGLIIAFPSFAVTTEEVPTNFLFMDENTNAPYTTLIERPERLFAFKSNIQRLSLGQMISLVTGGALGAYTGNSLVRQVIGRYANTPDRIAFIVMGTIFGAIFGGQWCDNGWWPC